MNRALLATVVTLFAGTTAHAADRLTVAGDPTKRWIEGDDLGFYYDIPMGDELVVNVEGPGTLIMFLVNHEATGTRGNSVLVVTKDKKAWKRLKLGCVSTSKRFTAETDIKPCKRMTRDLQIQAGKHRLGIRLKRTKVGASVHFLFASREQLDLEPEIASAVSTGDDELSWEEAEDLDLVAPPASVEETATPPSGGVGAAFADPWIWTLAGVAVASAGAGVFFGLRSSSAFADAEKTSTSQRDWQRLNDDGKQSATIANVLFATAGASLAGAALLFTLDASAPTPATPSPAGSEGAAWFVAPRVGPTIWGVDTCVQF